jgi:hypothetical protein
MFIKVRKASRSVLMSASLCVAADRVDLYRPMTVRVVTKL